LGSLIFKDEAMDTDQSVPGLFASPQAASSTGGFRVQGIPAFGGAGGDQGSGVITDGHSAGSGSKENLFFPGPRN